MALSWFFTLGLLFLFAANVSSYMLHHPRLNVHNKLSKPIFVTEGNSPSIVEQGVGIEGCQLPSPSGVNTLPLPAQASVFVGVYGLLYILTAGLVSLFHQAEAFPALTSIIQTWKTSWAPGFGLIFTLVGIPHFTLQKDYENIYPYQGAWGIWYLPGSPAFHVLWTGVAESVGGLWLLAASIASFLQISPSDDTLAYLLQPSVPSFALFSLVLAMTPANIFSFTHGAKIPIKSPPLPIKFHVVRLMMQVVLLAMLYEVAVPTVDLIFHKI